MTEGDMNKNNMRLSLVFMMALGLMLSETSAQEQQFQQTILLEDLSQDCQSYKLQCEDFCLNQNPTSDGVWASECWGSPLYVECKNSECKTLAIPDKPVPFRTRGPIRRPTAASAPPDCEQFKAECEDLCLNQNPTSDGVCLANA